MEYVYIQGKLEVWERRKLSKIMIFKSETDKGSPCVALEHVGAGGQPCRHVWLPQPYFPHVQTEEVPGGVPCGLAAVEEGDSWRME